MDIRTTFKAAANRHPEQEVMRVVDGPSYNWEELLEQIKRIANGLEGYGLEQNEPIVIYSRNHSAFVLTVLAAWWRGRPVAAFNHHSEPDKIPYYIEDTNASALLFESALQRDVEEVRGEIDANTFIQFGANAPTWATPFDAIRSAEAEEKNIKVSDDSVAFIGYSSGTTGMPKGVEFTHSMFLHDAFIQLVEPKGTAYMDINMLSLDCLDDRYRAADMRAEPLTNAEFRRVFDHEGYGDTQLHVREMYHTPLWTDLLACIMADGKNAFPADNDPDSILNAVEKTRANIIDCVPTRYKLLCDALDGHDVSCLKYLHTGGGILMPRVSQRIRKQLCDNLVQEYASSEAYETTYHRGESTAIGRSVCFQKIRVTEIGSKDPDRRVDPGEKGELAVKMGGPTMFERYLNKPKKTAKSVKKGWYFTEDIVVKDEDGIFWFKGRSDDMIISGGENISPCPIENALHSHYAVEDSGVIGLPDKKWGEKIVAVVKTSSHVTPDQLDRHCRESSLEDYKRPKEYIFVEELPYTQTSGVDRKQLRDQYA